MFLYFSELFQIFIMDVVREGLGGSYACLYYL